ncbi:hypothetical protein BD311DRAFT_827947 [Dichomitus squalens]|uniref:Nephrocystin 3-like N-terminal domain-containing protein n=1 Tax=Dichomitus squalens TaxID=114155 RepID=A0A4Q9M6L1_9APHY|nr:hypothetical protein BD311DRAFT_827947 [Dichomitus squalens]
MADFTLAFLDLRRRFTERGVLELEIRLAQVADIGATIDLVNLVHVRGAGLNSSKACLEGTRVKTLDELLSWINDSGAPPVRFLFGGAGTGKSAIAHSTGIYFKALRRLGSFFCFDRNFQGDRHPESVISTIARDLANRNPDFRRALANVLRDQRELEESTDFAAQWEGLILEPLKHVTLVGPVLVVIDAFDESSFTDARSRRLLLSLLTEGSAQLPPNFRILVTSRPERDVARAVSTARARRRRLQTTSDPSGRLIAVGGNGLQSYPSEAGRSHVERAVR